MLVLWVIVGVERRPLCQALAVLVLWWGVLPPVSRLQCSVNLFLACQTGFVPWEQLKSVFQWQSSGEGMMIG